MRLAAQKVGWAAEMSVKDQRQLKDIKVRFKIAQVVSGVYEVKAGRITITAQVVNVDTRAELFRKEV